MNHTIYIAEHDLVSAQKLHATPKPQVTAMLLTTALAAIALACAADRLSIGAAIGAVMCMSGLLAFQFTVVIPYHARLIYRQQKFLHQLHHFRWDDQHIHIRCAHSHGQIRWTDFTQVKENRDMLLLYRSGTLFNIFPKRCFASEDSLDDFRAHLASVGRDKPSTRQDVATLRLMGR